MISYFVNNNFHFRVTDSKKKEKKRGASLKEPSGEGQDSEGEEGEGGEMVGGGGQLGVWEDILGSGRIM